MQAGIYTGRRKLLTSRLPKPLQFPAYIGETLEQFTLADELSEILPFHNQNALEFEELTNYFKGDQPILQRPQGDREVNNKVAVNYAQAFTRDATGYTYAGGIQYVANQTGFTDDVQKINRFMRSEYRSAITKSMADNQSIGGTAYIGIFPDSLEKNDVPFELVDLSPISTAVVYSTYNVNVPVYAFTTYKTRQNKQDRYIFQIWTSDYVFIFNSIHPHSVATDDFVSKKRNALGEIPIIEYANNQFRIGDWECAIGLMNAMNNIASDSVNDVEQTIISYLVLIGVETDKNTLNVSRQNRLLAIPAVPGVQTDAKFITSQLDGSSVQLLRSYFEQALKFIVGIPDRDVGQAGSDTGISAEVRTGSGDLEIVAQNKVKFTEMAERRLIRILLKILKNKNLVSEEIKAYDIDIEIPRNKANNLQSKVQAGQILNDMGVSKEDVAKIMDLNTDITGFVSRWKNNQAEIQSQAEKSAKSVKETQEDIIAEKEVSA